MLTATTVSIWGITVALGAGAATILAGDGRSQNESHLVQQACAGLASSRQVEDALATIRGLSNDGFDPVCTEIEIESAQVRSSPRTR